MSKVRTAAAPRSKRPTDVEHLLAAEHRLREVLRDFTFARAETSVEIFKRAFRFQQLRTSLETDPEAKTLLLLFLCEAHNIMSDVDDIEPHVKNILKVFNKEDLKKLQLRLAPKLREARRASQALLFSLPKDHLVLQKLGKILKKVVLRQGFVTSEAFGQAKEKHKEQMVKPNAFKDQSVAVEHRAEVLEATRSYKSSKDKKAWGLKPFKWPERKEVAGLEVRVTFTDARGRRRSLYCSAPDQAQMFKNHCIFMRMTDRDAGLRAKLMGLRTLWKVRRAENFYSRHLQRLYLDKTANHRIFAASEAFRNRLKEYLKRALPNLYDSNYDPRGLYNFEENAHRVFKGEGEGGESPDDLEIIKMQLATIVAPADYIRPDQALAAERKRRRVPSSKFKAFGRGLRFDRQGFPSFLANFGVEGRPPLIQDPDKGPYIHHLFRNSKVLLCLTKLIVGNVFRYEGARYGPGEAEDIVLRAHLSVEQGNFACSGGMLVTEVGLGVLIAESQVSIKVDLNSLKHLRLRLEDSLSGQVCLDEALDLQGSLDTVFLESVCCVETELQYKEVRCPLALVFTLAFVPRNLEVAHITLSQELLDADFDRFEELVNSAESFPDYQRTFFAQLGPGPLEDRPFELFSHLDLCRPRANAALQAQENRWLSGLREAPLADTIASLSAILSLEPDPNRMLTESAEGLTGDARLGLNHYLDLIVGVLGLVSSRQRVLLNQVVFDAQHARYVNLRPEQADLGYHRIMIDQLNAALDSHFAARPHARREHRALTAQMTFEVYLLLENNTLAGEKYRIDFSPAYVALISNIVQVNARTLDDHELRFLIVNQILSTTLMRRMSAANQVEYLDSLCMYLCFLLREQYPASFGTLETLGVDYSGLARALLANSLASCLEPLSFAVYQDLKTLLHAIFIVSSPGLRLLELLDGLGLGLPGVIDVLLLLDVLVRGAGRLRAEFTPASFRADIEGLIGQEARDLKALAARLLTLLDFLYSQEFFATGFTRLRAAVKGHHRTVKRSTRNIGLNVKVLSIDLKLLRRIIDEEIGRNTVLRNRALSIYPRPPAKKKRFEGKGSYASTAPPPTGDMPGGEVDKDVYFEILEDHELDKMVEPMSFDQSLPPFTAALAYLNNLDPALLGALQHNRRLAPDLNSILELDMEELNKLCFKYFKASDAAKMELYTDMTSLSEADRVPLVRLLVVLCCTFSEDPEEVADALSYLALQLTRLYFSKTNSALLVEVIGFLVDEVHLLSPITFLDLKARNLLPSPDSSLYVFVRSGRVSFGHETIDVTEIVARHFASSGFLNKRPSIQLGSCFCAELAKVFEDLLVSGNLDTSIKTFELTIELLNRGELECHSFPFKVGFEGQVRVLGRHTKTLFFDNAISERQLVAETVLRTAIRSAPLFYFPNPTALKLSLNFVGVPFVFRFKSKELFLTVRARFSYGERCRLASGLMPWRFPTQNYQQLSKFASHELDVGLNYALFFLPIRQLFEVLTIRIVETLPPDDVFKFVKLNNSDFVITTAKNKMVEEQARLFDLSDFEKAVKGQDTLTLTVTYNS